MLKFIFIACFPLIFFSCANKKLSENQTQVIIKTSASCEMCVEKIEAKVKGLNGVHSAKLHLESKNLSVKYDAKKIQYEAICKAINSLGYDANEYKADEKLVNELPACCKPN